jgi:hypothetical protein
MLGCAAVVKFPVILPVAVISVEFIATILAVPVTITVSIAESYLKLLSAPALPALLYITQVLEPGTTKFPDMLPTNVP